MKNRRAIDVAQLLRNREHFLEKQFEESEKSSSQISKNTPSLAETDLAIVIPQARGLNPCLWRGTGTTELHVRPSVTSLLPGLAQLHFSPATVSGVVCISCQLV
jgi:hypothetical protein